MAEVDQVEALRRLSHFASVSMNDQLCGRRVAEWRRDGQLTANGAVLGVFQCQRSGDVWVVTSTHVIITGLRLGGFRSTSKAVPLDQARVSTSDGYTVHLMGRSPRPHSIVLGSASGAAVFNLTPNNAALALAQTLQQTILDAQWVLKGQTPNQ